MRRLTIFLITMFFLSCNTAYRITGKLEESHKALYKQDALYVYKIKQNKVYLVNPSHSRCYFLKGKAFISKWAPGDTMVINEHLEDFYKIRYLKKCSF